VASEVLVQVAYAIGVSKPVSLNVTTFGTAKVNKTDAQISEITYQLFDMRPKAIVERLKLLNPIYSPSAAYGHMGRESYKENGLEFFTWEKLDHVEAVKKAFGL
ncbi:MAG: methionine adenosyltransferase domain-containing protein, partial [Cytophagales bacterium]|nr:methionine adenosyltransferase domain-containing protein [Cytophagales bacterium]